MLGIVIAIPDIPVTIMLDRLTLIHLNIQQKVSICTSSFWINLDIQICEGKHPVTVKRAHKNGKQYLNIVQECLHFVQQKYMIMNTTAIHTIIIITCTTYSIAVISFKSFIISSSFDKFNVNSGG